MHNSATSRLSLSAAAADIQPDPDLESRNSMGQVADAIGDRRLRLFTMSRSDDYEAMKVSRRVIEDALHHGTDKLHSYCSRALILGLVSVLASVLLCMSRFCSSVCFLFQHSYSAVNKWQHTYHLDLFGSITFFFFLKKSLIFFFTIMLLLFDAFFATATFSNENVISVRRVGASASASHCFLCREDVGLLFHLLGHQPAVDAVLYLQQLGM